MTRNQDIMDVLRQLQEQIQGLQQLREDVRGLQKLQQQHRCDLDTAVCQTVTNAITEMSEFMAQPLAALRQSNPRADGTPAADQNDSNQGAGVISEHAQTPDHGKDQSGVITSATGVAPPHPRRQRDLSVLIWIRRVPCRCHLRH